MKHKLTFLFILLLTTTLMQAQVTIGSNTKPINGALLMLDDGTRDGSVNAQKGLGLPRVELTNLTPKTPTELSASIGGSGAWNLNEHIGLVVYNLNEDELCKPNRIFPGLHVWDGTNWESLSSRPLASGVYEVIDSRDKEVYLAANFGTAGDWMLENMRYDPIANPDPAYIGFKHSAEREDEPHRYKVKNFVYPEGNEDPYIPANHPSAEWKDRKINGLLYTWPAATNGENLSIDDQAQTATGEDPMPASIRGICPPNWYLPSDKEWNDLERELYTNAHLYSDYTEAEKDNWVAWDPAWETIASWRPYNGISAHAMAMKSSCPPLGSPYPVKGESYGTEKYGFSIVVAGYATQNKVIMYGTNSNYWTSSSNSVYYAWTRGVYKDGKDVSRGLDGRYGLSAVRCKHN